MGIFNYFKKKEECSFPHEALAAELADIKRKVGQLTRETEKAVDAVRELKDENATEVSTAILLILAGVFSIFSIALLSLRKGITAMALGASPQAATPSFMTSMMFTIVLMLFAYLADEKKKLN